MIYFCHQGYGYLAKNQTDEYVILQQLSNNHPMVNSELSLSTNLVQAKVYKDNNLKPSNNA